MKALFCAALIAASTAPPSAAELFSGTHTYRPDHEIWTPVPAAGWITASMAEEYDPTSGSIPAGGIECRGANHRNKATREASGVCVFGEKPDIWMLRYRAIETDRAR